MIRTLYKALQYSFVLMSCKWCTFLFRLSLKLNGVICGRNIKSMKSVTELVISHNAKVVHIGDNVVFNNYTDQSWYCRCKLMVREGASLLIGNNVGMNGILIFSSNSIQIGDNVMMGGVLVYMILTIIHLITN